MDLDPAKRNVLVLTRRKTGTNALIDLIYMLLKKGEITSITKSEIKDAIKGHAPITKLDMPTSTAYICHDFPLFNKTKIELFDRIIITHRELSATLTSCLDYYFTRRKIPILPCPFDVLLLRNWEYWFFEKNVTYLKAKNIPFKKYNFAEIGSTENIKDINEFLGTGKNCDDLSEISVKVQQLRSDAEIYDNGIMSKGGFANSDKKFPDWRHLEPKTSIQRLKLILLKRLTKHA